MTQPPRTSTQIVADVASLASDLDLALMRLQEYPSLQQHARDLVARVQEIEKERDELRAEIEKLKEQLEAYRNPTPREVEPCGL